MTVTVAVPQRVIRAADRRAQRRLHAVIVAKTYNDEDHPLTRLYRQAERLLDRLTGRPDVRRVGSRPPQPDRWAWEAAESRMHVMGGEYADEALLLPDVPLADLGDTFVYPNGVGR